MTHTRPAVERTLHILVEGRVQGVGFRMWVAIEAEARGLAGWVHNRRTGAVEAVLAGTAGAVEDMLAACRRGPPAARVDALHVIGDVDDGSLGTFAAFDVRATV